MQQIDKSIKLDAAHLEAVMPWGGANSTVGWVFRPNTLENLAAVFALARRKGVSVGLRGGGNSYGDAACNEGNIVLDLTRLTRILDWDPNMGVITVEPGVTLQQLWEYVLGDGWWPPVCTGTMHITIGGGAAMNVHGKNSFAVGTFGDHIKKFELMLPNGEIIECSRDENRDIFFAAIGGFGMLGCFTSLTLQMKRVYSGLLAVEAHASRNLAEMFQQIRDLIPTSNYIVGWVDCAAKGDALGRGQIHLGNYLKKGEDRYPQRSLQISKQHLGDALFTFFPRSAMWRLMQPFFNQVGVPWINLAKYWSAALGSGHKMRQPHAQFHFLLNYFPDWQKSVGKGGLIQYQPFVPDDSAEATFTQLLTLSQQAGLVPYLGVLKRHRPDPFLMTHGLDGWSIALDYRITEANRSRVVALCQQMDQIVIAAGGRFYPAKDSTLTPETALAYLGADTLAQFRTLKKRCDPHEILQTNFWRRVFKKGNNN
ncbi:MAG TPA: FAD-binding oxidoreductase [Anaerolineae bacterium]|nr:FAD-binding oxidoreductase [Anaerolineae bacterium]